MRLPSEVEEFERERARMLSPEPAATGMELLTVMFLLSVFVLALLVLLLIYFACLPVAWAGGLLADLWRMFRPAKANHGLKLFRQARGASRAKKRAGGCF